MLAASYLRTRDLDHIWYQVDSRDMDPATLFYYLELWLKSQVEKPSNPLPALRPEHSKDLSVFCKNYFEMFFGLCTPTPILVFDNCQKLRDNTQFFQIVQYMATQMPPGGQIFLISRAEPPSNFARMVLHQDMGVLRWKDFQLTSGEIQTLSAEFQNTALNQAQAETIFKKTMGWVAGVVVLLTTSDVTSKLDNSETLPLPEVLFDYFTGEIFAQFDEVTKNFLLKTAWLPTISAPMAQEVTGHEQADLILRRLARKNFFTIQHSQGRQNLYQYHPLFKEFLKKQARAMLPQETLIDLKCHAATLLIQDQRYEEAAYLFRLTKKWNKLGDLICEHAWRLIEQGRYQTLYHSISSLPEEMLEKKPWLLYWQGASRLPFAPVESKSRFEKAFALFESNQDVDGCSYAISGILNALNYQKNDFRELDRWFAEAQKLRDVCPEERSIETKAQLAVSLLTGFHSRAIQNPHFDTWIKHAESFWCQVPNPGTRLELASILLDYHNRAGNYSQCKQLVDAINELLQTIDPASNASVMAHTRIALFHWYHGEYAMARECCGKIMKNTQNHGIQGWDYLLWGIEAALSLCMGELEEADGHIEKLRFQLAGREPNLYNIHYYCLLGWRAARGGEFERAVEMFTEGVEIAQDIGAVAPAVYCHQGLANVLFARGDIRGAYANLGKAMNNVAAREMPSLQYQLLLSDAYFGIRMGRQSEGLVSLEKALALGHKHGYLQTAWWGPDIMEHLCAQALSNSIEVPWVKKLIHNANLRPDNSVAEKEHWPWPFRIFTLGSFSLEKEGAPLGFATKAPRKQLDMIKVIISLGGKNVSKVAVIDALWPDAEGDKATKTFGTTLHRLRRLLGNEHAVKIQDGKLSLDPNYCWVDCQEFEHLVSQAEEVSIRGDADQAMGLLEKAIELYRGPFLSQDELMPWMAVLRDRLKNTFLLAVERRCNNLESSGSYERAASLYNRGLAVEDFPEELYQRLMLCLKKLERKTEAISIYRQCKKSLETTFGIDPSSETEAIYRSIVDNK
ncbi:MAG: hypothetical protein JXK94_09950 [Deltaproteobacteria bacterium]|nr:hypothetical protein [Deltaproteobacteria bacterium]